MVVLKCYAVGKSFMYENYGSCSLFSQATYHERMNCAHTKPLGVLERLSYDHVFSLHTQKGIHFQKK